VLATIGEIPLTGAETRIVFEEGVGPVPVLIRAEDGRPVFSQLSVVKLPEVGPPPPSRSALAELLSLDVPDLLGGAWSPQSVSCGLPFLFVPVKDRDAVAKARIRMERWDATLARSWAPDVMVFTNDGARESTGAGAAWTNLRARVFVPSMGVPEDPATGSACAALGGYLATRDGRASGTLRWTIEQGVEMGRPSLLEVEADKSGGEVTAIRVGGASVMVSEGTIEVPD
jgi:trans-2,3-dihydro-3-hydroxyanthranilate isomerase